MCNSENKNKQTQPQSILTDSKFFKSVKDFKQTLTLGVRETLPAVDCHIIVRSTATKTCSMLTVILKTYICSSITTGKKNLVHKLYLTT